jgi:ABC-type nitrate/sulfonate/bicarbonate transport system permease component
VVAPFFLVWFGVGQLAGFMLVLMYTTVLIFIFSQRSVLNLDPVYENNAQSLGADKKRVIRDVLVPSTVPEVLGGLRIALAGAWGLEAVAELLGSDRGLGVVIRVLASGQLEITGVLAALLLLGGVAVVVDGLLVMIVRRLLRWRTT